jgi:hypothetical protein
LTGEKSSTEANAAKQPSLKMTIRAGPGVRIVDLRDKLIVWVVCDSSVFPALPRYTIEVFSGTDCS